MRETQRPPRWRMAWLPAGMVLMVMLAAAQSGGKPSSSELPPGSPEVMQPEALVKTLQTKAARPIILYVGPRFLYVQAHIPGAEYVGPAAEADSMERLRKRVAPLPKNTSIILYCGCCPWEHCPNIRPAHQELQKMGFTKLQALYLANNFGTDWVDKGYPVERENTAR